MAQAGWHSCSKLSPSILSGEQPAPPCSARKTKPLEGRESGWLLQALALGRQCFSTLAFPCESPGAQDLGSDLMAKREPVSLWTGDVCSVWCHQEQHCARRMWRWQRMMGSWLESVSSFFEAKYLLLAIMSTEVLWSTSSKSSWHPEEKGVGAQKASNKWQSSAWWLSRAELNLYQWPHYSVLQQAWKCSCRKGKQDSFLSSMDQYTYLHVHL